MAESDDPLVGGPVPPFELQNQYGETVSTRGRGEGRYFVVFYPFAFSRVCTAELAALERLRPGLEEAGVGLLAVSVDHKFALRAYAAEQGIGFDLLADFWPHGAVARAFGCFDDVQGRAQRSTFLVSHGTVVHHFCSDVGTARREQDYLDAIEQFPA